MKFNSLKTTTKKLPKRVGRGISAGQGKTAGRGTKGQNSRAGASRRPGFEGGQNPLIQKIPKIRGFKSHKVKPSVVYTGQLSRIGAIIDTKALADAGIIDNPYLKVKLVCKGEISKKHTVKLQTASEKAIQMIEKSGGSFTAVPRLARPARKDNNQK